LTNYRSDAESIAWTTLRDGSRLRVDLRNRMQARSFWSGEWDWPLVRRLLELVQPDHGVVDVGANIGFYSVPLARRLRTGRLWCFEPLEANVARLRENLEANGVLAVASTIRSALGAVSGDVELQRERGSATGNAAVVETGDEGLTERVPIARLDDVADSLGIGECHLLKIDTEGGELDVLHGARDFLARHRPVVAAELNPYWMRARSWTLGDLESFATELDYELLAARPPFEPFVAGRTSLENVLLVPRRSPLGERARELLRR
jgi:FkbM family methyltransferase